MSGKLDEISEAIGRLRASVEDLQRRIEENRELQERRYADNSAVLRDLAQKLDRHAASVEMIRPTVAALEISRSKLATWGSIGFAAVVVFGWLIEAALKWAVDRALSHFR
jgi:prefoldin subunit 5